MSTSAAAIRRPSASIAVESAVLREIASLPPDEVLRRLDSRRSGLTAGEVGERRARFGRNEVAHERPPAWYVQLWHAFSTPFTLVLVALAVLSYATGDHDAMYIIAAMVVQATATVATAQPQKQGEDPFAKFFYPPELVMAHQGEIGLTDRQRRAITEIVKDAQGKFLDMQFKMSAEAEKLGQLIQGSTVDEAKVLAQVDQVLTLEREVKHVQLSLVIRIKNQLTADQQAQLGKLRKQDWARPPEP